MTVPPPINIRLQRSLGTAVLAASARGPFFPPAVVISPHLRYQILAGHDINLVKILLCSSELSDKHLIECEEFLVWPKESDPRLFKSLTMPEFNVAFCVYGYDFRFTPNEGLNWTLISPLSLTWLCPMAELCLTYITKQLCSSKSAINDWFVIDLALISRHFAAHQSLSCPVRGSFSLPGQSAVEHAGPKVTLISKILRTPLCMDFNENVWRFSNCRFIHAFSYCGNSHPRSVCPCCTRHV